MLNLAGVLGAFDSLELAGLEKSDQFSGFSNDGHGADAVTLHQLLCVAEGSVWFDEEPRRDRFLRAPYEWVAATK